MSDVSPVVPAGWYPDPLDDQMDRWWNGVEWSTDQRARVLLPGYPATSSVPSAYPRTQESGKAVTILILGAVSIVLTFSFFLLGLVPAIAALVMSRGALQEIEQSNGTVGGKNLITAGKILAWIGIGIVVFFTLVLGFLIFIAILGSMAEPSDVFPSPTPTRLR